MPEADAEALLHEVVIAYLTRGVVIHDPKSWLVGAICNASRGYWRHRIRTQGGTTRTPEASADPIAADDPRIEVVERNLLIRQVLSTLSERDREVLRLRFFEQLTAAAIGERLNTTHGYAEKLIFKAIERARRAYARLQPAPPRCSDK